MVRLSKLNKKASRLLTPLSVCRSVMAFNLIYLFDQAESLRELAMELLDLQLPPPNIAASFNFKNASAAIKHLQSGVATGKVVLEFQDI